MKQYAILPLLMAIALLHSACSMKNEPVQNENSSSSSQAESMTNSISDEKLPIKTAFSLLATTQIRKLR